MLVSRHPAANEQQLDRWSVRNKRHRYSSTYTTHNERNEGVEKGEDSDDDKRGKVLIQNGDHVCGERGAIVVRLTPTLRSSHVFERWRHLILQFTNSESERRYTEQLATDLAHCHQTYRHII